MSALDNAFIDSSEEMPKPKILMSSTDITRVKAWEIAEKTKISAFARFKFFHRPNPEELTCARFVKYYEPYLKISGNYTLNCYRKKTRELVQFKNSATIIFDHQGKEVTEELPPVEMTEVHESFYHEHQHEFLNAETITEKAVEILKKRLKQRPQNIEKINSEKFTVNEITIIYLPVYFAEYILTTRNDARIIRINGCTASVTILPITPSP